MWIPALLLGALVVTGIAAAFGRGVHDSRDTDYSLRLSGCADHPEPADHSSSKPPRERGSQPTRPTGRLRGRLIHRADRRR